MPKPVIEAANAPHLSTTIGPTRAYNLNIYLGFFNLTDVSLEN